MTASSPERPRVSICLPTLNARRFLEPRVASILAQTMRDWELIVCDSHSDDGTWEYLSGFAGDPRVSLHKVPREGLYAGWNECLRRARGEFVYMATADDTMEPDCLAALLDGLEKAEHTSRHVDVAVCDLRFIDDQGRDAAEAPRWLAREFYGEWMGRPHVRDGKSEFLIHCVCDIVWFSMTAVLFRRTLLDRIGYFRTDMGSCADEDWEMRAALASDIAYVPGKLATWRMHGAQATTRQPWWDRFCLDQREAIVHDPTAGIPEAWKTVPGWDRRITHVRRMNYLDGYRLTRSEALTAPFRFLRGVMAALRREPRFLLSRLATGFRWSQEFSPDPFAYTHELIRLFGTTWPPQPLTQTH